MAQFVVALARNAIPVWGFLGRGWSPATTLVVYWCETLIGTLLVALRMAIHRHLTHLRGYYVEGGRRRSPADVGCQACKPATSERDRFVP